MTKLERKVYEYIQQYELCHAGDRLLVACSAGADSMALLHYLHQVQNQLGVSVAAVHVNHMLRGKDADGDRHFVETFCNERNIPVYATDIPIPAILEAEHGNMQAVCRRERYAYFEQVMLETSSTKLVVAHHADDQIESILMALIRGSHDIGMQGIKRRRPIANGELIRPFLSITRAEIQEYLQTYKQDYREDSSNKKDSYTRNRMRHHVVPLLKDENPKVAEAVMHYTEKVQADEELLQSLAEQALQDVLVEKQRDLWKININALQNKPLALQRRIILLLLKYLYKDTFIVQSYTLWNSILKLTQTTAGNATIDLPKGAKAIRQYDELILIKTEVNSSNLMSATLQFEHWTNLPNNLRVYIGRVDGDIPKDTTSQAKSYFVNATSFAQPLHIRGRMDGDRIQLLGANVQKRISRLFIDDKVPLALREDWPIIVTNDNEVIAVPGLRVSSYFSNSKRLTDDTIFIVDQQTL
ncbi:tRNA lysidine(34) synthetase TilS [Rummeliibacillus pycnus]|uniref:tRNA lysidine(34) synthetase TilS n=1 Tax=Rummeliibacillus pycnus TaxID=101070 RepID=UPI003D2B20BA